MQKPLTKKHLEIKEYTYLDISVLVKIDYDEGTISLITNEKDVRQQYLAKKWVFAGRTLDYMQGWQNILDSMKFAITQATAELQKHVDMETRERARLLAMVSREK